MINYKYFIIILISTIVFSQDMFIEDIQIEGLNRLNTEDIYRISKLYPGTKIVRGDEINKAINKLWDIGRFSDVQVYASSTNESSLILKIEVSELPVLGEIKFIGNKKKKTRALIDVLPKSLVTGQIISESKLFNAKDNILSKYRDDNFHNTFIDSVIINDTDIDYVKDVVFYIAEGKKSKIKKIIINGNDSFPFNRIFDKNQLSKVFNNTKEFSFLIPWRGKFNKDLFEEDLKGLENFYYNNGYRDFKILNQNVTYLENGIEIYIDIYEGERYYYDSINFIDNTKFNDKKLLDVLNISIGEKYDKEKLDFSISENLSSLYMDEGHYYFNVIKEVIPKDENQLILNLKLQENQQVSIRKIFIKGNNKTEENVIRRELKIFPGNLFNKKNIIESLKSLFMLNYFQDVRPEITDVSDTEIDIGISVVEKQTGKANFSMGYNQVNGFSGGGGFEFINFLGKGLQLNIQYQKGLQNQINSGFNQQSSNNYANFESFSIGFTEPRIFDSKNSIGFTLYNSMQGAQSGYTEYDTRNLGGSLTFGRQFKWPDYYTGGSWSIGIRSSKYYGTEEQLVGCSDTNSPYYPCDFSSDIVYNDGNEFYAKRDGIKFTQTISRVNIDNAEFATAGSKLIWSSTFSGGVLGGSENYHKHVFNFKWYTPVTNNKKLVFFQHFTFGGIKPLVDNEYINSRVRFSMGGSGVPYGEMLRGYLDHSIGSQISYYTRGGNIMFKYSAEFRFLLSSSPTMYLLLFADTGNIWSDFNNVDVFDLKRSAGIGFRLNMPMLGVIGYDIGYGFDHHNDDIDKPWGWEQHLIFGVPLN